MTAAKNLRTDEERALVRAEIAGDPTGKGYGESAATNAALLCERPHVAPDPAPQIPKPMTVLEVMGLVPPAELNAIATAGLLDDVRESIKAQRHEELANWADLGLRQEWISQATHDALAARAAETIDDPNPAVVLGDNRLTEILGRQVGGISIAEVASLMED